MNELDTLKRFRAERDEEPPGAKEAVWRSLEARIEAATELASPPRSRPATAKPGLLSRRRLLAFAGATAVAAVVAGTLVMNNGPTAQPSAAAEILHRAADAAASSDAPTSLVPGPGEFLYRSEQRLEVEGWRYPKPSPTAPVPDAMLGGTLTGPHTYNALVPTTTSQWIDGEGAGRLRQVTGTPQFWSKKEEARWKAAGSPLPGTGEAVSDTENPGYGGTFHFPDTSKLPTEAAALRGAVEAGEAEHPGFNPVDHGALDPKETQEELLNILVEGEPSPGLQAAIFDALAELPGIAVTTGVTDGLGRSGDAISSGTEEGVRTDYIFDPDAGELLATRSVLVDPRSRRGLEGLPVGTTVSERDFIETAVVGSVRETGAGAGAGAKAEAG